MDGDGVPLVYWGGAFIDLRKVPHYSMQASAPFKVMCKWIRRM